LCAIQIQLPILGENTFLFQVLMPVNTISSFAKKILMYLHRLLKLLIISLISGFQSQAQAIESFEVNDYSSLHNVSIASPSVSKINLETGVTLEYSDIGNPNGTPVIFLHGFTDSRHSFDYLLPNLPKDIRAIVITQRGHGSSDKPQTGYRPEDFAADLNAFMNSRNIRQAVIAGHSMGSTIAQYFAVYYPEKVSGLVLLSTIPDLKKNTVIREFGRQVSLLKDPIDHAFASDFQKSTIHMPIPETFLDTVINETMKVPSNVWQGVMNGLLDVNISRRLRKIKIPTLLMYGEKDNFSSMAGQEKLMAQFKNAQLIAYRGVGHALHWEIPHTAARDIAAFVKLIKIP